MSASVRIAPVEASHFEDVVRLFALLGPRYTAAFDDPGTREVFDRYLGDERKVGLVGLDGEQVVGVLLFEVTPVLSPTHAHARADGMVVAPSHRGRGIAHGLLREAFAIGAERRVTSFMIKASDAAVIAMYRRMPELTERGVYFYHNCVAL
jgi:ribosomal protein S18 acetylase RimI-like enzyme